MNKRIKHTSLLAILVLVATFHGSQHSSLQPARALAQQDSDTDGADFLIWQRTLGIVPGQMLRVTVANPGQTREPPPLFFLCKVLTPNGVVVFQTDELAVLAPGFRYEDINVEDLDAVVGDPGTGRRQVVMRVETRIARGARSSNGMGSFEIIDKDTGRTAIYHHFEDLQISSYQINGR